MTHLKYFLFLGTGASAGVPIIGCQCAVCLSSSPKNRRLRSSAMVGMNSKNFLIDAGPDLRQQLLTHRIDQIDALLLTHVHHDHISGLDDLRPLNFLQKRAIPCILSQESLEALKVRYDYLFTTPSDGQTQSARFEFIPLACETGQIELNGDKIFYFTYWQSGMKVTGYRFEDLAYVTDIRDYSVSLFDSLKGVKKLIISALRKEPSSVQFSLEEAVEFAGRVGCEEVWLTHISHAMEHEATQASLPPNVYMGYDGLLVNYRPNR